MLQLMWLDNYFLSKNGGYQQGTDCILLISDIPTPNFFSSLLSIQGMIFTLHRGNIGYVKAHLGKMQVLL